MQKDTDTTNKITDCKRDRQTTDRQTDRQQTDTQADNKQTDRQTDIEDCAAMGTHRYFLFS